MQPVSKLALTTVRAGMDEEVRVALLVRLEAKPGKERDLERFLTGALAAVEAEPGTISWHAMRLGPSTFGIYDAFPNDAARDAHLAGVVASALLASAPDLLAAEPRIERATVLAAKREPAVVRFALNVRLEAKPGKEAEVARFLRDALPLVEAEPGTREWFAIQLAPATFGIYDAFLTVADRDAHLAGKVAAALLGRAPELLAAAPIIEPVDVLAVKM
jgi:quinol monooxygenase YgiN